MIDSSIKVLDCTLRDGGYYTNWNFDNNLVKNLIYNLSPGLVDIVELGYRKKSSVYKGKYFFTDENILSEFNFFDDQSYAIMIDFADIKSNSVDIIDELLPVESCNSVISTVRIACDFNDYTDHHLEYTIQKVIDKGYSVCVNIMKCSLLTGDDTLKVTEKLDCYDLQVIYFADSYGALTTSKIIDIFSNIAGNSGTSLGFHGHDNMGCAFSNSLLAVDLGFEYIDGTVLGMGRGAGNTDLETLCLHFNKFQNRLDQLNFSNLGKCFFSELKSSHKWGYSNLYHLAANNNIHPSYIQLITNMTLDPHKCLELIDFLIDNNCNTFNVDCIYTYLKEHE